MLLILNMVVQFIAFGAGIYIAFSDSISRGLALIVLVIISHFFFSFLSNKLIHIHQKTLPEEELKRLMFVVQVGSEKEIRKPLWTMIATSCGLLFLASASALIYNFLIGW